MSPRTSFPMKWKMRAKYNHKFLLSIVIFIISVNPTGVIDFILKCTNIEGKHLVPVETQAEYENLIKSKQVRWSLVNVWYEGWSFHYTANTSKTDWLCKKCCEFKLSNITPWCKNTRLPLSPLPYFGLISNFWSGTFFICVS